MSHSNRVANSVYFLYNVPHVLSLKSSIRVFPSEVMRTKLSLLVLSVVPCFSSRGASLNHIFTYILRRHLRCNPLMRFYIGVIIIGVFRGLCPLQVLRRPSSHYDLLLLPRVTLVHHICLAVIYSMLHRLSDVMLQLLSKRTHDRSHIT